MNRRDAYMQRLTAPLAGGTVRRDGRWAGGWVNPLTGQGSLLDRHTRTAWEPPPELPRHVIDGLLQFSGMMRRLSWREPYDCTREGFDLDVNDPAMSKRIMHRFRRLASIDPGRRTGGLQVVSRARQWARAYGSALIVGLLDDQRDFREPLDLANLRSFRGLRVLDRHECAVARWDERRTSARIGQPEMWHVTLGGRASFFVHASRVIQIQGLDLPERVLVQRQGHGGSVFDLVHLAWRNYSSTLEYLPEIMTVLSQGVFKQKGLAEQIMAKGPEIVAQRYETLRAAMGVLGELAIDADMEDYSIETRGVSGVADLMAPLLECMLMEVDTPRVIMKNETVGGLNTGENSGEIRAWYDYCAGEQIDRYEPPVETLLTWECAAKDGPTGGQIPEFGIKWKPLWQPTRAEDDTHDKAQAERRQIDVMASVVKVTEARRDPSLQRHYGTLDAEAPPEPVPIDVAANGPVLAENTDDAGLVQAAYDPPPGGLRTPQEIGDAFGVSPGTLRGMHKRGEIGGWRLGRQWRYSPTEVAQASHRPAIPPAAE